jgi:hypothetical protein
MKEMIEKDKRRTCFVEKGFCFAEDTLQGL